MEWSKPPLDRRGRPNRGRGKGHKPGKNTLEFWHYFHQRCAHCGVILTAGSQEDLNNVANMHVLQEHVPMIFGERGPEPLVRAGAITVDEARERNGFDPEAAAPVSWIAPYSREEAVEAAQRARIVDQLAFGPSPEFLPPERFGTGGMYSARCHCGFIVEALSKDTLYLKQRNHIASGHEARAIQTQVNPMTGQAAADSAPVLETSRKRIIKPNPRLQS